MTLMKTRCVCGASEVHPLGCKDDRPVGRCVQCGLVRTCSVPPDYEALYTDGDQYHAGRAGHTPYRDRYEHDCGIAKLRWPALMTRLRLLDVGCANGAFVSYAAGQGVDAEGLEPNAAMAGWAARQCDRRVHTSWDTVRGPFDIITYHDVIEHVPNPCAELLRAHTHLRAEGILVVDTPDAADPRFASLGLGWHHMKPQEHLWFFTEAHLRALACRAGFDVEQVDRPIPGKLVLYARSLRARPGPSAG